MKTFKEYLKEQPDFGNSIDVFFNNLDELTQKKIMEAVMAELNVSVDDDYANKKIVEGFSKTPLTTLSGKEIVYKIKFNI